jgi:hypothetical protein
VLVVADVVLRLEIVVCWLRKRVFRTENRGVKGNQVDGFSEPAEMQVKLEVARKSEKRVEADREVDADDADEGRTKLSFTRSRNTPFILQSRVHFTLSAYEDGLIFSFRQTETIETARLRPTAPKPQPLDLVSASACLSRR